MSTRTLSSSSLALARRYSSTPPFSDAKAPVIPFSDPKVDGAPAVASSPSRAAPSFLSLADLSTQQITRLVALAQHFKSNVKPPVNGAAKIEKSLADKTVALLFSKRSTRTRIASETSVKLLGGHSMFLGKDDIQLGVNESLHDSAVCVAAFRLRPGSPWPGNASISLTPPRFVASIHSG